MTGSAISKIKIQKETILHNATVIQAQYGSLDKKKRSSLVENIELDKRLYKWFLQMRSLGEPVTGALICQKALMFNEELGGPASFVASSGYVKRFKDRHAIKHTTVQGDDIRKEEPPLIDAACEEFSSNFQEFLDKNYSLVQIYNADVTGLYWKSLPTKTSDIKIEDQTPEQKEAKDRVSVMICANAEGTHRIPLLVTGKLPKSRCFKNTKHLPVTYRHKKNSSMNKKIFTEWYVQEFLPQIEEKHGTGAKCLLILRNCSTQSAVNELNELSDICKIIYFPTNVTPLAQSTDQEAIETLKRLYRKDFVRELLIAERLNNTPEFLKSWNLSRSCDTMAKAWDSIKDSDLNSAWKNMCNQTDNGNPTNEMVSDEAVLSMLRRLPQYADLTVDRTARWLREDQHEPGWQVTDDGEILFDSASEDDSTEDEESKEEEEEEEAEERLPSVSEALQAVNTMHRFIQSRQEFSRFDCIKLQRQRDVIAKLLLADRYQ